MLIQSNDYCQGDTGETIHGSMLCADGYGTGPSEVREALRFTNCFQLRMSVGDIITVSSDLHKKVQHLHHFFSGRQWGTPHCEAEWSTHFGWHHKLPTFNNRSYKG